MIKKLFAGFFLLSVLFLSGCQLAKPEESPQTQDRLAGVLITKEPLDLFDMEAFLNDNAGDLLSGRNPDTGAYEGRLYGELTPAGKHEDGSMDYDVSFPDADGYFWVNLRLSSSGIWEEGEEYYWCSTGNEGLYGIKSAFTVTDEGEKSEVEATIAFWNAGQVTLYVNPVYQTGDGRIYAVTGNGLSGDVTPGVEMSHSLSDTFTTTENGETRTQLSSVTIRAVCTPPTKEILLIQMSASHEILAKSAYTGASFPESLTLEKDTAYLIVQTDDGYQVQRTICQSGDEYVQYFVAQGEICLPANIRLNWANP